MNRFSRVIVAVIAVLTICSSCLDSDDTATVITIETKEQLKSFRDLVNSGYNEYYGLLMADIDLEYEEWTPIGDSDKYPYMGVFNGNGYTIENLKIDTTEDYQGLFGYMYTGYVSNLTLENPIVTGGKYVGGICGRVVTEGYIFKSKVVGGTITGTGDYVGGVVGDSAYTTLENLDNSATVKGGGNFTGGIAGYSSSVTVTDCNNTGNVSSAGNFTGGVIGQAYGSNLVACYNTGTVSQTESSSTYVGGVAGRISSSMIACYNTGNVTASGSVGGVVGYATSYYPSFYPTYIISCYNSGTVTADSKVGGVVGESYEATLKSCYFVSTSLYGVGSDKDGNPSEDGSTRLDTNTELNTLDPVINTLNSGIYSETSITTSYRYEVGSETPTLY